MAFPTNTTPAWKSYMATGNTADIVASTTVAAAIGGKVDASSGQSLNQTLETPTITGGTVSTTDIGASLSTASNSIATGTRSRTPAERAMSYPQPQDFLTSSQSVSDLISGNIDVGPIINTMISSGIKTIHIPCGTYKLATTINLANNVSISGDGAGTIISDQMSSGNAISASAAQYLSIKDMVIQSDATRTSGNSIYLYNTFECRIYDIIFTNGSGKHWTNIELNGSNGTHISNITGRGGSGDGIWLTGTEQRTEDTYINNSALDGYGASPLHITWASGIYLTSLDLLGGVTAGINIDPATPGEVDGLRGTSVLADSNIGPGWLLSGTGAITEFNITNCWGSTNGYEEGTLTVKNIVSGFSCTNTNVNNLTISSSEFHNNTGAGIDIEDGQRININGNMVFMNSSGSHGEYAGINIGSNPNFVLVTNNMSGAGGEAQGSLTQSYQSYAIVSSQETTDTSHYAIFSGNFATGNQTGNFDIPTSTEATNIISVNNVGF